MSKRATSYCLLVVVHIATTEQLGSVSVSQDTTEFGIMLQAIDLQVYMIFLSQVHKQGVRPLFGGIMFLLPARIKFLAALFLSLL